jgi:hypothetical protein
MGVIPSDGLQVGGIPASLFQQNRELSRVFGRQGEGRAEGVLTVERNVVKDGHLETFPPAQENAPDLGAAVGDGEESVDYGETNIVEGPEGIGDPEGTLGGSPSPGQAFAETLGHPAMVRSTDCRRFRPQGQLRFGD